MTKVKNYARFYACLNSIQTEDKDDLKVSLVYQFTRGRTSSLKEMKLAEYNAMCDSIDPKMNQANRAKAELKTQRSAVLRRLQMLGVDTTSWEAVDRFCLDTRISGKRFYDLTPVELNAMIPKLIAISKKPKPQPNIDRQLAYLTNLKPNNQLIN